MGGRKSLFSYLEWKEVTNVEIKTETQVEIKPEKPENWRTLVLIGAFIAVVIVIFAYVVVGVYWGTFALAVALYEAWTLVNAYKEDTISEAFWYFANRPIIPLLFGVLIGIGIGSGYLGEPKHVARAFAIGLLYGHFFFTPVISTSTKTVERLRNG